MPDPKKTRSKPNILCVDDTPANLIALESLLKGFDVDLVMARSGQEAIALILGREPFSLILMDIMMPGMDGLETAERIRALERGRYTPLIFVTAYPLDHLHTLRGYKLGAADYIQKPIAPEILQSKIRVFVDLHNHREELHELRLREIEQRWETERLRKELETEHELVEMSALFRLFVNSIRDYAIFLMDSKGNIFTWNPGVMRIFGYEKEEFEGLNFSQIFTPEDIERRAPAAEIAKATSHGRSDDTRWHLRKDGTRFWADGIVVPLNDNGNLRGFAKLVRDRTEGKLTEETLRDSEERLRLATESTNLGTWQWNPLTRELEWSDLAKLLHGLPAEASRSYEVFLSSIHPEDRKRVEEALAQAHDVKNGGDYRIEYRSVGAEDKVVRWLSVRGKAFFDDKGIMTRMLGTCWDVSERRRMEEDLHRSNEDLERFAHLACHDLQEPLRTVVSFLQLLEKKMQGALDKEAKEYLHFSINGAYRMKSLVQELLVYCQAGSTQIKLKTVQSQWVLNDVMGNLKAAIDESRAVVTSDPLPQVLGDPIQLVQLFQNLIANAIKYRGSEPLKIHVSSSRNEAGWLFCVQDNGIGISMEYADRIFEPFWRLQGSSDSTGSGLGLSVCKRIVERHGGKIWLDSAPGKGSKFHFTLASPP